jgi:hypothetical protein
MFLYKVLLVGHDYDKVTGASYWRIKNRYFSIIKEFYINNLPNLLMTVLVGALIGEIRVTQISQALETICVVLPRGQWHTLLHVHRIQRHKNIKLIYIQVFENCELKKTFRMKIYLHKIKRS